MTNVYYLLLYHSVNIIIPSIIFLSVKKNKVGSFRVACGQKMDEITKPVTQTKPQISTPTTFSTVLPSTAEPGTQKTYSKPLPPSTPSRTSHTTRDDTQITTAPFKTRITVSNDITEDPGIKQDKVHGQTLEVESNRSDPGTSSKFRYPHFLS